MCGWAKYVLGKHLSVLELGRHLGYWQRFCIAISRWHISHDEAVAINAQLLPCCVEHTPAPPAWQNALTGTVTLALSLSDQLHAGGQHVYYHTTDELGKIFGLADEA